MSVFLLLLLPGWHICPCSGLILCAPCLCSLINISCIWSFLSISPLLNDTKWTQSFLHFMKGCSRDPVGPPANCNIEKAIQGFPGVCKLPCSVLSVSDHSPLKIPVLSLLGRETSKSSCWVTATVDMILFVESANKTINQGVIAEAWTESILMLWSCFYPPLGSWQTDRLPPFVRHLRPSQDPLCGQIYSSLSNLAD